MGGLGRTQGTVQGDTYTLERITGNGLLWLDLIMGPVSVGMSPGQSIVHQLEAKDYQDYNNLMIGSF